MNLKPSRVLILVLLAVFTIALLKSIDETRADVTYCTFCCNPGCDGANGNATPTPTPTPTATPTPTPTPSASPTPTPSPDAIVAPSGGTHTSIGAAYAAVSCGDLIWVRNGTYTLSAALALNKDCAANVPVTIQNYPDEEPKVTCSNPESGAKRVEIYEPTVWDGIEIYMCYNGINLFSGDVKILNSKIHNNMLFGILFVNNNGQIENVEIAGNTIELNGYVESETCTVGIKTSCTSHTLGGNPVSAKNAHGIYLSQGTNCNGIDGVHIHDNHLRHAGGRAIQTNGSECSDQDPDVRNVLIEHNTIENNSWGMAFFYRTSLFTIQNNTFIGNSWPDSNDTNHTFIGMWNLTSSDIKNNTFTSSSSSMQPLFFISGSGCPTNDIDFNEWTLNTNNWIWADSGRSDFSTNFTSVSGCGSNDTIN